MNNDSFPQFARLPAELRLMVWERAAPTYARALLVVYERAGSHISNLALAAYAPGNWVLNPQRLCGVALTANAEALAVELATYRIVDVVGDIVRVWEPDWDPWRENLVNFERDMLYLAIEPLHFGAGGVPDFRALLGLGRVTWAYEVRSLALLVGDAPGSYWGRDLDDGDIRETVRRLTGLQRFWVVLSLAPFWPAWFDYGLRTDHGFMPADLEFHAAAWPWFGGEYTAVYSVLIDRITAIAAEEGRGDLEVRLVFDINHRRDWWFNHNHFYARYINTW